MAQLKDLKLSTNIPLSSDIDSQITTKINDLSIDTVYETKEDAEQKLEDANEYTDEEISKLSSELSNYWKISRDPEDKTKVVSQEMDYLVMRDWATPEGQQGHNLKRFMYVKQVDWYCDPSKNTFNAGPDVTVDAEDGTSTKVLNYNKPE